MINILVHAEYDVTFMQLREGKIQLHASYLPEVFITVVALK